MNDKKISKFRNEKIGIVFQEFNLLEFLNTYENISLPLVIAGKYQFEDSELKEQAKKLLEFIDLTDRVKHYPKELSGGEQQRIAIARALITHPDLLLADEPTGALDSNTSNEILELFDEVNANGQTIIMVTHSAAAASHAKRTLFIKDGRIYHELYRGDLLLKDYQQQISQTMMTLTNGGE